ncbi:MAG: hypothetical protein QF437_25575 [Planctomycetota bacterium]|jgi:hypothetical protein|nr:hypothetical protein [Planctomycetota bacterium]MDP7133893.1 hypothetical protein [Planctomycetota bacterium]MDP7253749.1 hypothetical protein [Planctomycetota bacterium]
MKTKESPRGISRQGLDSAFEADERRKSNLLLTARSLREEGKSEESANTFAEVAEIEERLSSLCEEAGLPEKAIVHRFSAAGCWAQAGDFYHAIAMCDSLLSGLQGSHRMYSHIEGFVQALRIRRSQWYASLEVEESVRGV